MSLSRPLSLRVLDEASLSPIVPQNMIAATQNLEPELSGNKKFFSTKHDINSFS